MIPRLIRLHKYYFGDYEFIFYPLNSFTNIVAVSRKNENGGQGYIYDKCIVKWHNRFPITEELKVHIEGILKNDWQEVKARWGLK